MDCFLIPYKVEEISKADNTLHALMHHQGSCYCCDVFTPHCASKGTFDQTMPLLSEYWSIFFDTYTLCFHISFYFFHISLSLLSHSLFSFCGTFWGDHHSCVIAIISLQTYRNGLTYRHIFCSRVEKPAVGRK